MNNPQQFMSSHLELTELLIKHHNLHKGLWAIAIEFKMAAGNLGTDVDSSMPSGIVGISRIGIQPSTEGHPLTVDASISNPEKKTKTKKANPAA